VGRPAGWQRDGHADRAEDGRSSRRRRRRQAHQLPGLHDEMFVGEELGLVTHVKPWFHVKIKHKHSKIL